ncbi:hypothetical protein [Cohnella candidum]|uniref:Ferric oxidoreductase domain-containing protein n=1 Tax=Cohnella candidum TaxID=2674991 RepID=A0A3G3JSH5_9BACL|nr:hypothetical protein [Cohnella candidum]AYQ71175.1 hypothetical protein EAV92_00245 [Cohnella candidum]
MKSNRTAYIPAILVALASLGLLIYSLIGVADHGRPPMNGGVPPMQRGEDHGAEETFKLLGTLAVYGAAASYAWLRLKRSRRSPSPFVRFLVRWFDKLHQWLGYAALILIAVHGFYFLTQAAIKRETYTGIAGLALLLSLGVYGFLIRRVRNKHLRKIHFLLATAFAVIAIIHAGGTAIIATLGVVAFWGVVWLIERKAAPSEETAASN